MNLRRMVKRDALRERVRRHLGKGRSVEQIVIWEEVPMSDVKELVKEIEGGK